MFLAAKGRHTAAVGAALRLGADPNATDSYGYTALMEAALKGHADTVAALLEGLLSAEEKAEWESVTKPKIKQEALWSAAHRGDAAAVVRLAAEGASADAKKYGEPVVLGAAEFGHTEVVEALLRLGCDPNAPNRVGYPALMLAAMEGHGGVVGALLEVETELVRYAASQQASKQHDSQVARSCGRN